MAETMLRIAIAGNPNSGKTTAFNKYTGARQHVGNYPGITVEKKEGFASVKGREVILIDLPGTYSLTAYSLEEVVARNVLTHDKPGAVIDVVNASVLERNLYLAVQLLEMGVPVVLALNMMDEARSNGIHINIEMLESKMGVKAVPTVARTGEGLEAALEQAIAIAEQKQENKPLELSYGADVDNAILEMLPVIEAEKQLTALYPSRWVAIKVLENDSDIRSKIDSISPATSSKLTAIYNKLKKHLETTLNTYPEALIAEYRYGFIASVLKGGTLDGLDDLKNRIDYSDKMDKVLTNRVLGPIILFVMFYLMYWVTFSLGEYPAGWLESAIGFIRDSVDGAMSEGPLKSLILSGVIDGVGGVLGFVPLIIIMYLIISFFEDSGYMARVAYMADRIFRFFGLHGASVMPFIVSGGIAGGCAVPGIMAARTLRSPRERIATILTAPFMTCGAKLPVFMLFVSIFYEGNQALVMFLLTIGGWLTALIVARVLRSTLIKGEATPFVMELPPYRLPTVSGIIIHTWERAWMYIKKAGTIILAISIVLWAAMNYPKLPDEEIKPFEDQKAPIQAKLEETEYGKLKAQIDEIKGTIEGLPEKDAKVVAANAQIEPLTDQLKQTATGKLEAQIDDLNEQIEKLGENEELDGLLEELEGLNKEHEIAVEKKRNTAKIDSSIEDLKKSIAAIPAGKLKLEVADLEDQLGETDEKKLEAEIADIDNEQASKELRWSVAGRIGTAMEGITKPAGFDWKTNIALVGGIAAKEVVVSTLGTAYSLGEIDNEDEGGTLAARIAQDPHWNIANATALLLFTLLYSPCFVTIAVIKHETGKWRWAGFSLVFNLVFAYIIAVITNQLILSFMGS